MSTIRPTRVTVSLGVALALTLGLSGCGSDMQDGATPQGTPMTTSAPETAEDTMDDGASAVMPMSTGDPFADLRTAAQHMPDTASTLAGGFVTALEIPGEVDSAAAGLRAALTSLLQEHVYLAGTAVATAYAAGPDSPEFEAAAATLDENSVALSEAIGSLAGEDKGEQFLELWREHVGYFVDYAVAAQAGDTAGLEEATANLKGYTQEAGAFFEEISAGELPADAIAEALSMHVTTLSAAIDDLAAGSPEAYASLQQAASHVVDGAATIATGLATATDMAGDPNDEAATLRAQLTALLQEHAYLAGVGVFTAYTTEGGTGSDAFEAAAGVLDENSVALAEAVGSLAGADQEEVFLPLWREHIGYFVDYADAVASGDDAGAQEALTELDTYRGTAGDFFEEISAGELPSEAVAEGLAMHVQTLAGAIDSLNTTLVDPS